MKAALWAILAMILIATPVTAEARCFKFQRDGDRAARV